MSKIKFVRKYTEFRHVWYDVVYHSNRIVTYLESKLPKSVQKFIEDNPGCFKWE